MGFDQYHEPPDELPAETRTFARLCASLTEEAEAIGWYEQRLAVEPDREARAIMRDAQGEEFKHFAWTSSSCCGARRSGARSPRASSSRRATSSSTARRPRRRPSRARPRAARRCAGSESLGIGGLQGSASMSHLLREHAPITEAGWELLDDEARERLTPALAARKLVDFAGPHGWEHSATNLGRVEALGDAPGDGVDAAQRRVLPLVELRAPFTVSRARARRRRPRRRGRRPRRRSTRPPTGSPVAENVAVFHGWGAAGIAGIAEASTARRDRARRGLRALPAPRRQGGRGAAARPGSTGPTGSRSGPEAYTRVIETSRARRLPAARPPAQDPRRADRLGAGRARARSCCSLRGGDFLFESGEDLSIGYDSHDADAVHLYLEESFSFRVATPEAAVALTP